MRSIIEINGSLFRRIEAKKLSMDDEFMKWEPQTIMEGKTKDLISEAIQDKVKNFYHPIYDPSTTDDGRGICFLPGKMPAVGKTYFWWESAANNFCPKYNSRLGARLEYGAFLGVLIKELVEVDEQSVEWAWNVVCNNSREIGHYYNSANSEHVLEPTGSREVCGFYDLANTYKILERNPFSNGVQLVSGNYDKFSCDKPVAHYTCFNSRKVIFGNGVGWIVLDA